MKMIQHTEWDKKTGKKIITMVPQPKWHKNRTTAINKALSSHKEPNEKEKLDYQRRTGRGYNE